MKNILRLLSALALTSAEDNIEGETVIDLDYLPEETFIEDFVHEESE